MIEYLVHSEEQKDLLRYVFFDGAFIEQLQSLVLIGNYCYKNFCFICKEPSETGAGDNHFILGILVDNKVLFVNPIGKTRHKGYYNVLKKIEDTLGLQVYASTNQFQFDSDSCGPICVELMNHFSRLTPLELFYLLGDCREITLTNYFVPRGLLDVKSLREKHNSTLEQIDFDEHPIQTLVTSFILDKRITLQDVSKELDLYLNRKVFPIVWTAPPPKVGEPCHVVEEEKQYEPKQFDKVGDPCPAILKSGPREGKPCNKPIVFKNYCKRHVNYINK